jgi:hypothetical protein
VLLTTEAVILAKIKKADLFRSAFYLLVVLSVTGSFKFLYLFNARNPVIGFASPMIWLK